MEHIVENWLGKTFDTQVALKHLGKQGGVHHYYWTRCNVCSHEKRTVAHRLATHSHLSCGHCDHLVKYKAAKKYLGKKLGRYTVTTITREENNLTAILECECGLEKTIPATRLKTFRGISVSCSGCLDDLVGKKFNHWTVIEIHEAKDSGGHRQLVCQCDCGLERPVRKFHVLNGVSKSCSVAGSLECSA